MPNTLVNPELVLNDLLAQVSERKRKSLQLLYDLLKAHHDSGQKDFSVATLGRLSRTQGGPSTQTIRNVSGADYRHLIQVWAAFSNAQVRKTTPYQPGSSKDFNLLPRIADPAIRAVVASIIAERNVLLRENRLLKNQAEVIIDKRPKKEATSVVLPASPPILNEMEREALEHSISETTFRLMGWRTDETGRVKPKDGNGRIYKAGYVPAIKKILAESSK